MTSFVSLLRAMGEILAASERIHKAAEELQRFTSIRIHQLEAENAALRTQLIVLREERRLQGALGFIPPKVRA